MLDLELTTAPSAELVTLAQAKADLRLDGLDDHDGRIQEYLDEAVGELDGFSGSLGRALAAQTWTLYLDRFPAGPIRLPLPPLISVDAVAYVDADGADQAFTDLLVAHGERAEVRPAFGFNWPTTRATPRAVAVTFTCGWPAPDEGDPWPQKLQPIRAAIKLLVQERFEGSDERRQAAIRRLTRRLKLPRT